jgi:hypothetical protein
MKHHFMKHRLTNHHLTNGRRAILTHVPITLACLGHALDVIFKYLGMYLGSETT